MKPLLFALVTTVFLSNPAGAAEEDLLRFAKCWKKFIRTPIQLEDPVYREVKAEKISGVAGCGLLLDRAKLVNGVTVDPSGIAVLEAFHGFHQDWISGSPLGTDEIGAAGGRSELIDVLEDVYFFDWTLWGSSAKFSERLNGGYGIKALRTGMDRSQFLYLRTNSTDPNPPLVMYTYPGKVVSQVSEMIPFTPAYVPPYGNLRGFKLVSGGGEEGNTLTGGMTYPRATSGPAGCPLYSTCQEVKSDPTRVNANLGKGYLTTQAYLSKHWTGGGINALSGTLGLPREYFVRTAKQTVCRDLPLLRPDDVAIDAAVLAQSVQTYHKSVSCLQCHMSMDGALSAMRGVMPFIVRHGVKFGAFYPMIPNVPAGETYVTSLGDKDYYRRIPKGRLRMRTYRGELIDREVDGPSGLAAEIGKLNDHYVCSILRYYEFFTGNSVKLRDPGAPSELAYSPSENEILEKVEAWAKELQAHQNLRLILDKIIADRDFIFARP